MKMKELKNLSLKQVLSIVGFWNSAPREQTSKMFKSFTDFVGAIQKGCPDHENSCMVLNLKSNEPGVLSVTKTIPHAFHDMFEYEEDLVIDILKEKIQKL